MMSTCWVNRTLFNGDYTDADYYKNYPTIYHLRKHLMESEQKEDIRLVYLALHNIVKCRGNFIHQDNKNLSASNANADSAVDDFVHAIDDFCEIADINVGVDETMLRKALSDTSLYRSAKEEAIKACLQVEGQYALFKTLPANVAKAIVGKVADFSGVFGMEKFTEYKLSLKSEDKVDEFLELIPDEFLSLFEAIHGLYSAYILGGLLQADTLSGSMIIKYQKHANDLEVLQDLVKRYLPQSYDEFFRGPKDEDGTYIPSLANGYTAYILGESHLSQDDLYSFIKNAFASCADAMATSECQQMFLDMDEGTFLTKPKNRNNGTIPFQLHLEEMDRILDIQGAYYPFLLENREKIKSLVSFRIPYYVGPLNSRPNPTGSRDFAWSVRKEGKGLEKVYPWNWEEIIDKDASAEEFIKRMTGQCTYLYGEEVLPRCSLLYEEFCVLNELNSVKWNKDGENFHRFELSLCQELVNEVFKRRKSISHRAVSEWLGKKGFFNITLRGTQDDGKFVSQLSSYNDFRKILGVEDIDERDISMVEELILWCTVFEDREILKRKVNQKYRERLTPAQVKQVCSKRYTGWGRLSKKFLTGLVGAVDGGARTSVMDVMRNYGDGRGNPLNLMEILNNKEFGFGVAIETYNKEQNALNEISVQDIAGSPALKRGVNQSLRIVQEIISIAGHAPEKICVEVTREDNPRKKGVRTDSRYKQMENAYKAFKRENPEIYRELQKNKDNLSDDRLMLYFAQMGKSLYSGRPLSIDRLSQYQIDHILPQSYIKDDSFDNRALVLADENERKLDSMLLDDSIINSQKKWWAALRGAELMSEKKFNNLTRREVRDRQLEGFVNRQLVETSQVVKNVTTIMQMRYPDTRVVPVKAAMSSGLRDKCGFIKCREVNDYHHAHDAYLACQIDRFVNCRYPKLADGFDLTVFKRFIRSTSQEYQKTHRLTGTAGFIVESFQKSGFDKETGEIFKDDAFPWDAESEIKRIRRCFNYKDCFISHMPEITSGKFWDETIYSPKDPRKGKNLEIPLKNSSKEGKVEQYLDPAEYGGPSGKDYAYFFFFETTDAKGKQKVFFEGVPLFVASHVAADPGALEEYARLLTEKTGCTFVRVLKRRVFKYQKIELDGSELYVTGYKEVRNAREIALSENQIELLVRVLGQGGYDASSANELYLTLLAKLDVLCPRLSAQMGMHAYEEGFLGLAPADKGKVLSEMLAIINGSKNMVDISAVGGAKFAGCMQLKLANLAQNLVFVDGSVTGMFERRSTLEL